MDCRSVSAAERVCDCDEGVQCPNERKPIFFMWAIYGYPGWFATADVLSVALANGLSRVIGKRCREWKVLCAYKRNGTSKQSLRLEFRIQIFHFHVVMMSISLRGPAARASLI